jgi:ribosomal protein S18 acetylase RimI-like enzyme
MLLFASKAPKDEHRQIQYYQVFLILLTNLLNLFHRHVQVNNDTALEFYKKFNFQVVERKEQYYKRIEPSDAFVLSKKIEKTHS